MSLLRTTALRLPTMAPLASGSRSYAKHEVVTTNEMEIFREILYPQETHKPKSVSPTGEHHHQVEYRLPLIVPNDEVHETIERAFKHYNRVRRQARSLALLHKFQAMEQACDELKAITSDGRYPPDLYAAAVSMPNPWAKPRATGQRVNYFDKWDQARIDGLLPREAWVPTDTKGTRWEYDWTQPKKD